MLLLGSHRYSVRVVCVSRPRKWNANWGGWKEAVMGGQQVGVAGCRGGPDARARSSVSLGLGTGEPKENAADFLSLGPDTGSGHGV